jgi:hypothetical protein
MKTTIKMRVAPDSTQKMKASRTCSHMGREGLEWPMEFNMKKKIGTVW